MIEEIIQKFYKDTNKELTTKANTDKVHYSVDYVEWLENELVKISGSVTVHDFNADFENVDCDQYEYQQMTDDVDEKCHLGIGIDNCAHCYRNKALYVAK